LSDNLTKGEKVAKRIVQCPECKHEIEVYKSPVPTVDIIIEIESKGIVLIKRKNPPYGWAIPGGFVDYGETLEEAAIREAKEETNLDIELKRQFHTYSDPGRDPRHHTISTVFLATGKGMLQAKDDASKIGIFTELNLPDVIAFDHRSILNDYFNSIF
jgi:ADP-ribose pyrophosphatase YjhB (NUDIX family)